MSGSPFVAPPKTASGAFLCLPPWMPAHALLRQNAAVPPHADPGQRAVGRLAHHVPAVARQHRDGVRRRRSEEHTSELQSLMRISYAVFCLTKKNKNETTTTIEHTTS